MTVSPQDQLLISSAKAGNLQGVIDAVTQGAEMNKVGIDGALFFAAKGNHIDVVKWMVEHGALVDIHNAKRSTPLMAAAESGSAATVTYLLEMGANRSAVNNDNMNARGYAKHHGHNSVIALLDRNPDEVVYTWPVYDRTLQEVFNFAQKERVTMIRKGTDGPVEAVTRQSFAEIEDKAKLREAFEQYRKFGGKRAEDEIFSNPLNKAKLTPKEMMHGG